MNLNYNRVCSFIFELNPNIRFAGVINNQGKIIAGGMREGVKPLSDEVHRKRWLHMITISREMNSMFDKIYGDVIYVFTYRRHIKQLTFYLGNDILFISIEPIASVEDVMNIAMQVLKFIESEQKESLIST